MSIRDCLLLHHFMTFPPLSSFQRSAYDDAVPALSRTVAHEQTNPLHCFPSGDVIDDPWCGFGEGPVGGQCRAPYPRPPNLTAAAPAGADILAVLAGY
jgi:hypothetical protein